jgi:hypothetical protein
MQTTSTDLDRLNIADGTYRRKRQDPNILRWRDGSEKYWRLAETSINACELVGFDPESQAWINEYQAAAQMIDDLITGQLIIHICKPDEFECTCKPDAAIACPACRRMHREEVIDGL